MSPLEATTCSLHHEEQPFLTLINITGNTCVGGRGLLECFANNELHSFSLLLKIFLGDPKPTVYARRLREPRLEVSPVLQSTEEEFDGLAKTPGQS